MMRINERSVISAEIIFQAYSFEALTKIKPAATREQVYQFAWAAIEAGYPKPAATAVICFEFLQRPENVLAGYLAWPDYRGTRHHDNAPKDRCCPRERGDSAAAIDVSVASESDDIELYRAQSLPSRKQSVS